MRPTPPSPNSRSHAPSRPPKEHATASYWPQPRTGWTRRCPRPVPAGPVVAMAGRRDEILAATDLVIELERFVGPGRGRGRSARWPCSSTGHGPQTGRTPPVAVFTGRDDLERWKCHACGAGGTAIDVVLAARGGTVAEALDHLASGTAAEVASRPTEPRSRVLAGPSATTNDIERWVAACEERLWTPAGGKARRWLEARGLGEQVLRANRVGADPGADVLPRPPGHPQRGPAVVLPALDRTGKAVYAQSRTARTSSPKYLSPSGSVAPLPLVVPVRPPAPPPTRQVVFVCEGVIDAMTAAQWGWRACAILGAGNAGQAVATELTHRYPGRDLVLAFDDDPAGQAATERLMESLECASGTTRPRVLTLPPGVRDINDWLILGSPTEWPAPELSPVGTIDLPGTPI